MLESSPGWGGTHPSVIAWAPTLPPPRLSYGTAVICSIYTLYLILLASFTCSRESVKMVSPAPPAAACVDARLVRARIGSRGPAQPWGHCLCRFAAGRGSATKEDSHGGYECDRSVYDAMRDECLQTLGSCIASCPICLRVHEVAVRRAAKSIRKESRETELIR